MNSSLARGMMTAVDWVAGAADWKIDYVNTPQAAAELLRRNEQEIALGRLRWTELAGAVEQLYRQSLSS